MNRLTIFTILFGVFSLAIGLENKARYDNYRLYRVTLKTDEHVKLFQELEERSDSYEFYGHARQKNQKLTFLAAAHKIGQMTYLLKAHKIEHVILVNKIYKYKFILQNLLHLFRLLLLFINER